MSETDEYWMEQAGNFRQERDDARAENARLRAAIKPFAEIDTRMTFRGTVPGVIVKLGDVKRAKAAYQRPAAAGEVSILDNEGHDPQGLGNRPSRREVLCACTDSCALQTEIERLRAWAEDEQRGRHKAEEDRMNARSEIERLRAALKPFAKAKASFEEWDGHPGSENFPLVLNHAEGGEEFHCTLGDLRRAAEVINQQQGDQT